MIDPSGIKPKNDKLIVKEVKPGVHTIENAYEGVHEDFTTSNFDVVASSSVEGQYNYRERSLQDSTEDTEEKIERLRENTTSRWKKKTGDIIGGMGEIFDVILESEIFERLLVIVISLIIGWVFRFFIPLHFIN